MSFHSKGVTTLVVFKDNVASTLNIVHTKDDDEVTLKKLGKETSQESRTVKGELKSYEDHLVMTADMQIYNIIVDIIFTTPDLKTKVILRPIFEKNKLNNMAGLENNLSELSAKSRTTKAFNNQTHIAYNAIHSSNAWAWLCLTDCNYEQDASMLFRCSQTQLCLIWILLLSLIDISTKRSWTAVAPWRAYT